MSGITESVAEVAVHLISETSTRVGGLAESLPEATFSGDRLQLATRLGGCLVNLGHGGVRYVMAGRGVRQSSDGHLSVPVVTRVDFEAGSLHCTYWGADSFGEATGFFLGEHLPRQ